MIFFMTNQDRILLQLCSGSTGAPAEFFVLPGCVLGSGKVAVNFLGPLCDFRESNWDKQGGISWGFDEDLG